MNPSICRIAIALNCLAFSACAAPSAPEPPSMSANTPEKTTETSDVRPASQPMPASSPETTAETSEAPQASIVGAIRIGTRAAPAMRVCAMAVSGSGDHCVMTAAGATQYRIDNLPAGSYYLAGWVRGGEMTLLAHASIVRCVMAPCPPDQLRVVEVAARQAVTGIDLSAPYAEVPKGWPGEPAE